MTKTLEDSFIDWETTVFGYGYGTGEPHILKALKGFLANTGRADMPNSYDYQKLEAAIGAAETWFLINALCKADIIEYGTSPRFGWLTPEGERLKAFVDAKSVDELAELCCNHDEDHDICYPNACNCGPNGYEEGRVCQNPFWRRR